MSAARRVVLYQPQAPGGGLPLALVHLGSMLPDHPVQIVDGRLELAPEACVADLCRDALLLGVTVRSGGPIADAIRITRAARDANPRLAVIWGGPHPSLLPEQCLASGLVDACVRDQGERTFVQAFHALRHGASFEAIAGVVWRRGDETVRNQARPPEDVNRLPAAHFGLLEMERYFSRDGRRRLDYCTSWSGPECKAGEEPVWSGLHAARVGEEIRSHAQRYRLAEVRFVDEGFFADTGRAVAIATAIVAASPHLSWCAGGRPEHLRRFTAEDLRLLAAGGCRRIHVEAAEASGPELLEIGAALRAAGIGARFSLEIGAPDDPPGLLESVFRTARTLREMDGAFETPIRFHVPRADDASHQPVPRARLPERLEDWGELDLEEAAGPWVPEDVKRWAPRYDFYLQRAYEPPGRRWSKKLVHWTARLRVKLGFYGLDLERRIVEWARTLRPRAAPPSGD
jgi:hypothetical protein